jgi:hypothetical protein
MRCTVFPHPFQKLEKQITVSKQVKIIYHKFQTTLTADEYRQFLYYACTIYYYVCKYPVLCDTYNMIPVPITPKISDSVTFPFVITTKTLLIIYAAYRRRYC